MVAVVPNCSQATANASFKHSVNSDIKGFQKRKGGGLIAQSAAPPRSLGSVNPNQAGGFPTRHAVDQGQGALQHSGLDVVDLAALDR